MALLCARGAKHGPKKAAACVAHNCQGVLPFLKLAYSMLCRASSKPDGSHATAGCQNCGPNMLTAPALTLSCKLCRVTHSPISTDVVSVIRKCVVHSGFEENEVSASSAVGAVCLPGSNHDVQCVYGVPEPLAGPGSGICTVVCRHCCGCGIVKQAGW